MSGEGQDAVLVLGLDFHFLKGRRGQESYAQEAMLHPLVFDFGLGMDPLIQFLALAFLDNAFADNITPNILFDMEKQLNRTSGRKTITWLRWKPEVLKIPVMRQCGQGTHRISNTQGMTYNALVREFSRLQKSAGFLEIATLYGIRRGAANSLNGNSKTPKVQVTRLIPYRPSDR